MAQRSSRLRYSAPDRVRGTCFCLNGHGAVRRRARSQRFGNLADPNLVYPVGWGINDRTGVNRPKGRRDCVPRANQAGQVLGQIHSRAAIGQHLDLGQLIHNLRTNAGLSQRELADRMGTTQSVISRLKAGGGARNRINTLARVATALNRHLVLSFPVQAPDKLTDEVQVA